MTGREALWASILHTVEVAMPFVVAIALIYWLKDDPQIHALLIKFVETGVLPALGGVFLLKLNRSWNGTGTHDYVNGVDTQTPGPEDGA